MLGVRVDEVESGEAESGEAESGKAESGEDESGEAGVMLEDIEMGDWGMIWLAWEIDGGEVMIGVWWVGVGACLGMV